MKISVKKEQTLLECLSESYPESSNRTLRNWIKNGKVSIDGHVAKRATLTVFPNQTVYIGKAKPPKIQGVEILYEDKDLIIIDKPKGLLSVPLDKPGPESALMLLRKHFQTKEIFAVHRIDRKTSGVLVFTKSLEAMEKMKKLFKDHNLVREYLALVEGKLLPKQGVWKSYLFETSSYQVLSTKDPKKGKIAITHYEVIRSSAKLTYLKLTLETGRKHQIRVHCKDAGHPIVGDIRYGAKINHFKRLCLHAYRICFTHPFTNKEINVISTPSRIFEM